MQPSSLRQVRERLSELIRESQEASQGSDPDARELLPWIVPILKSLSNEPELKFSNPETLSRYGYAIFRYLTEVPGFDSYGIGKKLLNFSNLLHEVAENAK